MSKEVKANISALKRYQDLALGTTSLLYLFKYELIMLLSSWVPGALGYFLRKILYPKLLGSVGRGVVFGQGVVIRHGLKIHLGDNVVLDDRVNLDARGGDTSGIRLGNDTIVSRNTILACKDGTIRIGDRSSLGINTLIHALPGSGVIIGDDVLIAAFVYLIGSGPYGTKELDIPFKSQGQTPKGGIKISENVWIGSNVQVMDGVSIGTGVVVGCSTVVNKNVPAYEIVAGVPMRSIRSRKS